MKMNACMASRRTRAPSKRRGTTLVEMAVVLPVFFAFVFGIIEFGRLQLVSNMLTTACRNGARLGAAENVTTAMAKARVQEIMSAILDTNDLTILVKDAGVFDTAGPYPNLAADYASLVDAELEDLETRQCFLVRATVAYNDIALIPFPILDGVQLSGQALMRHE